MKDYFTNKVFLKNLYKTYLNTSLSLNDHLAAIRSILANERTFLSYQRSALAFAITGFTLIKFSDVLWMEIIGIGFLPFAVVTAVLGVVRYRRMRNLIFKLESATIKHYNMQKKL